MSELRNIKDLTVLHNKFTESVAAHLHYNDCMAADGDKPKTAAEVMQAFEGSLERIRTDYQFKARVHALVGSLMQATNEEIYKEANHVPLTATNDVDGGCPHCSIKEEWSA